MKKISITTICILCSISMYAQELKLPSFYSQREAKAPLPIKDTLAVLRKEIAANNLTYQIGYTSVAEFPIEKLGGFKVPTAEEERQIMAKFKTDRTKTGKSAVTQDRLTKEAVNPYIYGDPSMKKLDLRQGGFVTPVRNDKPWFSVCWAFSAMASYEISYKALTNKSIDASEQFVVDCADLGDWTSGGRMTDVFDWMVKNRRNLAEESTVPYTGPGKKCAGTKPATDYYAADWGRVNQLYIHNVYPTLFEMKEAICKYGGISTGVCFDNKFRLYVGGDFFGFQSNQNGYSPSGTIGTVGVVIIGWDDYTSCWLIKNSWGTGWGSECGYGTERGYMWIRWNSNNIGMYSTWVQAALKPGL